MFVTITKTRRFFFFFSIVSTRTNVHFMDIPKGWTEDLTY